MTTVPDPAARVADVAERLRRALGIEAPPPAAEGKEEGAASIALAPEIGGRAQTPAPSPTPRRGGG